MAKIVTFTPTPEQSAIVAFAKTERANLLVNALAGAAKTTTLELVCKAVNNIPILSLAFNKRIAEEMIKRLPTHVTCKTLNGLGHSVWATKIGKRAVPNTKKSYSILKAEVDGLRGDAKSRAYDSFSDVLALVQRAKNTGYIPENTYLSATHLLTRDEFLDTLDERPTHSQMVLVEKVLAHSIALSFDGDIDFDDQIYMPTLFGGSFPKYPLVLIDEAQDLSPLNHEMLQRLVAKRIIAVGDPFQSIYGFRGAVSDGMGALRDRFQMLELPLNISFRCPRAIVSRARFRAPTMQWAEWAIEGVVEHKTPWSARSVPDGAAIICRNNAPLFSCALRLLASGRGCRLVGSDVGPRLLKVLKKLGPPTLSRPATFDAIEAWIKDSTAKSKRPAALADQAECLRVFANAADTLGGAIAYAEHLFKAEGPIQLLSGHKAKGLEWDVVFHLDPWRIPSKWAETPEEIQQDLNVRYVIETRAKKELYLVNLEDFE